MRVTGAISEPLDATEISRLTRFLRAHKDSFALALARIPHRDVRREFVHWVEGFCQEQERTLRMPQVDRAGLSPVAAWRLIAEPTSPGSVTLLTGMDSAFQNPDGEMLSLLNRQRERIAEILPGPVLLVLGDAAMDRFLVEAPDLADWRAATFELRSSVGTRAAILFEAGDLQPPKSTSL